MVNSRWLYKIKYPVDDSIEKHKAQFVVVAAEMGWKIHWMDVKTTFLNGLIEEEVYIEQPQWFKVFGRESHVHLLKKALYGLKQAP